MSDRCRRFYDQQLDLATPRAWNDLVPRSILADVAREHGGDRAAGKLTAPVHFWVLVRHADRGRYHGRGGWRGCRRAAVGGGRPGPAVGYGIGG